MRSLLPACWLLLWTLTVPVSCYDGSEITMTETDGRIKLSCTKKYQIKRKNNATRFQSLDLEYKDENTGEYECVLSTVSTDSTVSADGTDSTVTTDGPKIYVKFRTCDNCIELDLGSITGIVVGDVVATIVIGVAVYLIASQTRTAPVASHKKRSDRQPLVVNDMSREPNDHYQPLNVRQKDTYDVLTRR